MNTLLQINTSIHADHGQSSQLATQFVQAFSRARPDWRIVRRDLASDTVPHLSAERFAAFVSAPQERSAAQREVVAYSDALIGELKQADVIVLGLPMYNFGVPSQLKAYFDHIARAGETFRYTANGPVGLLQGKRAYIFAARGACTPAPRLIHRPTTCAISCASWVSKTSSLFTLKAWRSVRRARPRAWLRRQRRSNGSRPRLEEPCAH
jgi:FMN-dependent NADH-azoreductase